MRTPLINGVAAVRWRTLNGIDFQLVAPYVMVAKPDHHRAVWVWLRKDQDTHTWHAHVTAAGAPAGHPVARDASASGALEVAMSLPIWSTAVKFKPTRQVPAKVWSYPEGRSYKRRPGDYPDRTTAHDSRWDTTRSGGPIMA